MIPVITIDGPASSGKGTVARQVAAKLGFHYLESGAIYRVLGLYIYNTYGNNEATEDEAVKLISKMQLEFNNDKVWLNKKDVTLELRSEFVGMLASKYSALPKVREELLEFQRNFRQAPGLVTDGRDMGSIVFPEATLKIFLTASPEKRAQRRNKQLQQLEKSATIQSILEDIKTRDEQDTNRQVAPLGFDSSYQVLDNSELTIDETINLILEWYARCR